MSKSVGIKELKDTASRVLNSVIRTKRPVAITKNNKEVARIVPVEEEPLARLIESGLITCAPESGWRSLKLEKVDADASPAIRSIRKERHQE